ncbi:hypothetical protein [Aquisphaera insulae]|uniref:hypothetical protein n=1 Tax=Aquisphaera insulae TaxID=2712864 RepID=UPI0013ED272E|nr:hypothetical protein [Aquisphaera insulae]
MLVTIAARYLVPDPPASPPEGFDRLDAPLRRGLPHPVQLTPGLRLLLIVPSGVARTWREADPTLVVSSSSPDRAPALPDDPAAPVFGDLARPPARLLLQRSGTTVAVVPLVAGAVRRMPDGDDAQGVAVEVVVLDWLLHAGTLVGPGDFGSRLSLAWRTADTAVSAFSEPPLSEIVLARLRPADRLASVVGVDRSIVNRRFQTRRFTAR